MIGWGSQQIVTDGLVLHLDAANQKSYIGSGTTWNDISGYRNSGTLLNGATFSDGSILFDGVNDYVSVSEPIGDDFSQITINSWVNVKSIGNNILRDIVSACDGGSSGVLSVFNLSIINVVNPVYLPIDFQGINVYFGVRTNNNTRPVVIVDNSVWAQYLPGMAIDVNPNEFSFNRWLNICGVYNGANTLLYINGVLKATSILQPDGFNRSQTGTLNISTVPRTISNINRRFNGNISIIQIYSRALNPEEVLQNYNVTKSRFEL